MSDTTIHTDLQNDNIYFYLDNFLPIDIFSEYNSLMSSLHCSWDKPKKKWYCKPKKFKEIELYLEVNNWSVSKSRNVLSELEKYNKGEETITYRHNFDNSCLKENVKLFDFQEEANTLFINQNRSYNFNFTGLGKTMNGIALFSFFYLKEYTDKIFIFVLSSLSYNWKRKILEFSNLFNEDDIIICNNENKFNILENKDKKIFIIGYEFIPVVFCNYCPKTQTGKRGGKAKLGIFDSKSGCRCKDSVVNIKEKIDSNKELFLIIDESHKLMNPDGVWFKLLNNHKKQFYFRHLMTATPHPNRYEQIWAQMHILDESILNLEYKAFCTYIAKEIGNKYSPHTLISYDDEKIAKIQNRIANWGVKKLKSDIDWFNKEKIVDTIFVELDSQQRKLYEAICNFEFKTLKEKKDNGLVYEVDILNRFPYISQVIDFPEMLYDKISDEEIKKLIKKIDFSQTGKMKVLKDYIEKYMDMNEKLIVVDWRPKVLDYLANYFKKYGCDVMHGEQDIPKNINKQEYRQLIVDRFNDKDSDSRILFLSSLVGGTGFDLNVCCKYMIFFNLSWDVINYIQTADRIYRINNEFDAEVKLLVYDNTIDTKRLNIALKREKLNLNVHKQKILTKEEYKDLFLGLR